MAITVQQLFEKVNYMDITLEAGRKGIFNEVSWTHMVDSKTISSFLMGKELVFTTGVGLGEDLTLIQLVTAVYQSKASGIVLNIGPYITAVGEDVIRFGDEHNFPIYTTPWETHMADIIHIFSFAIIKEEQGQLEVSMALNNAFFCPMERELYLPIFMKKGYQVNCDYRVAIIQIMERGEIVSGERLKQLYMQVRYYLNCNYKNVICCAEKDEIRMVLYNDSENHRYQLAAELTEACAKTLSKDEFLYLSFGKEVPGLESLGQSYSRADWMQKMLAVTRMPGENGTKHCKYLFSEDMGMYKLLFSIDDYDTMREYVNDTVQPLYDYDKMNQGNLVEVLTSYLWHNGSVKEVAEEMIVHRNTVNYNMKKIEHVISRNLSDFQVRFEMMLGFLIYHMMDIVLQHKND